MGNPLILFGILLVIAGMLVNIAPHVKLPLLPGDLYIQKEGFTFYFPLTTSILVSIALTVIFRIFK